MYYESITTIDYLKVCYNNLPITYYTDDIFLGQTKNTTYCNKNYLSTFYDVETGFYLINNDITLKDNSEKYTQSLAFDVFYKNEIMGILYTDFINNYYSFFKYDNTIFYYKTYSIGFISQLLENTFSFRFNNITWIDIALDTTFNAYSLYSPIIQRCSNNFYFANESRVTPEDKKKYSKNLKPLYSQSQNASCHQFETTLYIGNIDNGKGIKIYNKSDFSRSYQKTYFYQNLGNEKTIYRIELSLRNNSKYKLNDYVDFFNLDNQEYINGKWINLAKPLLKFKKIKNQNIETCINKLKFVNPVNLPVIDDLPIKKIIEDSPKKKLNEYRRFFKANVRAYLKGEITYLGVIKIIKEYDLRNDLKLLDSTNLEKNINIALSIIHSIAKDFNFYDLTIYNKLIEEINKIEIPEFKPIEFTPGVNYRQLDEIARIFYDE